jgi:SAM-dependent methyltransferase
MGSMIVWFMSIVPEPVKTALKSSGIARILSPILDKYTTEIAFQAGWARKFKANRPKVLEYWENYRYLGEIKEICKINGQAKVLDVGCGISSVLHFVEGKRYGIDPLAEEYKKLYRYPEGIDIRQAGGESIPFPAGFFDVVFCTNVLDHTTDPQKTIHEIQRVLRPNGRFVLTVEVFEEKSIRDPAHPHSLTRQDLNTLLAGRFKTLLEKESPWIGLANYVNGSRKSHNQELIMVCERT